MKKTLKPAANETDEQKRHRETVEGIARNVSALADAVTSLLNGPLKRKAISVLLAKSARMPEAQVAEVLVALENLKKDWLNS